MPLLNARVMEQSRLGLCVQDASIEIARSLEDRSSTKLQNSREKTFEAPHT
jgi:hypothetical protein